MITFSDTNAAGERVVNALLWGALMAPLFGLVIQKLLQLSLRGYLWSTTIFLVASAGAGTWWVTDAFQVLVRQRYGSVLLTFPAPRGRQVEIQANDIVSARFAEIGRRPRPSFCYLILQTASNRYESQADSCTKVMAALRLLDGDINKAGSRAAASSPVEP